ncbi:MAG: succinyldiaminopimelate transaminase [Frankiaceae bacterium]
MTGARPSGPPALPDFPWDRLLPAAEIARSHPAGIVDLSVGTPVDPTPAVVQVALAAASDASGYPLTAGTVRLREAAAGWLHRRCGVTVDPVALLPTIGSKELVASLPAQLGISGAVSYPGLAYPTYEVGARLAGCEGVPADSLTALGPRRVGLLWVNSPANPTGQVLPVDHLRKVVTWARQRGTVIASDECYVELGWDAEPVSILHPDVCDGDHTGLLAVHSLSKRSNLAGYRAAFVAGDPALVAGLLALRRHAGLMMPTPVQVAMAAALDDDAHVTEQRERYRRRRDKLRSALTYAGFSIEHSEGGLYLWATAGDPCWETVHDLAGLGILVAPGDFYGAAGAQYVRVALTATDERVAAAVDRLRSG